MKSTQTLARAVKHAVGKSPNFIGRLRTAEWLAKSPIKPSVFAFRNIESGQVLFTQEPRPQEINIKKQFTRPNWQNKRPPLRRDLWRPMAVIDLQNFGETLQAKYSSAVELYKSLCELRRLRDVEQKQQANVWRKKWHDGNIWYSSQFRPTYSQEAVADVISGVEALLAGDAGKGKINIYWENEWRKGADEHWADVKEAVDHHVLPTFNPRDGNLMISKEFSKSAETNAAAAEKSAEPQQAPSA